MAITVKLDTTEGLSGSYVNGLWQEVKRTAIVRGITATDETALTEATGATAIAAGLPAIGSALSSLDTALLLEEYNPQASSSAAGSVVKVGMVYRRVDAGVEGGDITLSMSGGGTLTEITTQIDKGGTPITVESAEGRTQMGEISVKQPQRVLSFQTIEATDTPGNLVMEYSGTVNADNWNAGATGTWLCSVTFERFDMAASPKKWKFAWNFQYDETKWDPQVFYVDEATGKPPANLVEGTGFKTIPWYTTVDFNTKF